MNKYTYEYTGQLPVAVMGVGEVQPGQIFQSEIEINHPLFKQKTESKKKGK